MRHQRFISIRLSGPHMTCSMSRLLTTTFTTADFVRSSLRLFEAFSYKTAPKGPPSSFIQHNAQRVFLTQPLLQRLAHHFQHIAGKLWSLVEEEHAVMCQRHLAWTRDDSAADQPCI